MSAGGFEAGFFGDEENVERGQEFAELVQTGAEGAGFECEGGGGLGVGMRMLKSFGGALNVGEDGGEILG